MKPITTDGMASSTSGSRDDPGRFVRLVIVVAMAVVVMPVVVVVRIGILVEALLAVEHQEVHAERIEGRDEHAGQHREVREARAPADGSSCTASMMLSLE